MPATMLAAACRAGRTVSPGGCSPRRRWQGCAGATWSAVKSLSVVIRLTSWHSGGCAGRQRGQPQGPERPWHGSVLLLRRQRGTRLPGVLSTSWSACRALPAWCRVHSRCCQPQPSCMPYLGGQLCVVARRLRVHWVGHLRTARP